MIFYWDCGNEGLIFSEDGEPVIGLSGRERKEWILPQSFRDGLWHTFYLEMACNDMAGNGRPPVPDVYFKLQHADLVWPNAEARSLELDFTTISDAAKLFPESSWQKHRALEIANAIINAFDESDVVHSLKKCRQIANKYLGSQIDSPTIFSSSQEKGIVVCVGHCHIDTAWLWPYAETRRKIVRSWASQLDLIQRYPEYNFVISQAIQFQWLKEDHPLLFNKIKEQVNTGRIIPIGGSWVECDTNLPSGESVIRQFLYGQRFFEANFGIRCKTFWLPDTFGYAAQIPQLCRGADMERFLTQKLSWNNINRFPHTTFNWVALDGSQVLCHMPPADTYNSNCSIEEINRSVTNHKDLGIDESSLLVFGFGDGGGGPTSGMLEKLRRARGISDTVGILPKVEMHGNVDKYFDDVTENTDEGKNLVSWVGELYFEFHRGTYTSEGFVKKSNRMSEVFLHDLEYLATMASLQFPEYQYPKQQLDHIWEFTLLNQFHDVLPGSSIEMVYDDVREIVKEYTEVSEAILRSAVSAMGVKINEKSSKVIGLNTLPWGRNEVVHLDSQVKPTGAILQTTTEGYYMEFESSETGFIEPLSSSSSNSVTVTETAPNEFVLENDKLKVAVTGSGIVSMYDKHYRKEIIVKGLQGNKYVIFDDKPLDHQGWDTEVYSLEKYKYVQEGKASILDKGPLRASVVIYQEINTVSWIKTIVSLDRYSSIPGSVPGGSYLEFNVEVEWQESCKFLKAEFPVTIQSDFATYDSMYGAVRRPTHRNTSWDVAKFEVCTHKFADLSDYTYGVSIVNDSKYGFGTHGNIMRISLLRAPKSPDAHADMGRHHIRYSVFGHEGGLNSNVVQFAYNFNHPIRLLKVDNSKHLASTYMLRYDGPQNVIVSAIKRGEDDGDVSRGFLPVRNESKSVIVRLYDSLGGSSSGELVTEIPIKRVFRTNFLEDDKEGLEFTTSHGISRIPIDLRAFEIASLRLEL